MPTPPLVFAVALRQIGFCPLSSCSHYLSLGFLVCGAPYSPAVSIIGNFLHDGFRGWFPLPITPSNLLVGAHWEEELSTRISRLACFFNVLWIFTLCSGQTITIIVFNFNISKFGYWYPFQVGFGSL